MPSEHTPQASWTVKQNSKARKGENDLPGKCQTIAKAVKRTLMKTGKATGFDNYGPVKQLGKNFYHCHIGSFQATYVMVWKVDKNSKTITVTYIGTHENAPY
ncbi:MAG: hypothetical protein RDU30_09270 [Desulfovibrionaceae bacterium]|nr:hypothetical protein [Desulfovibrionaceae bacterium]